MPTIEMNGQTAQATTEVAQRALAVPDQARDIVIHTNEDLEKAGVVLTAIKGLRKEIAEVFDPIIQRCYLAHKQAVKSKKEAEAPLVKAEGIVKPRMAEFVARQDAIRQEEEARLQREAEKAEEERRLKEAEEAEKNGHPEEAEAILNEPEYVPPVVLPKATPKLNGVAIRKIYKYRIINADKLPRNLMKPDEVAIGQYVRALKEKANIAGALEVYTEDSVAAKSVV